MHSKTMQPIFARFESLEISSSVTDDHKNGRALGMRTSSIHLALDLTVDIIFVLGSRLVNNEISDQIN